MTRSCIAGLSRYADRGSDSIRTIALFIASGHHRPSRKAGNKHMQKKVSDAPGTGKLLMKLVPKYFAPEAVVAITGGPTEVAELLRLPFDFIFFTGSARVAKIVLRAAAENITPVVLELGGQNPAIVDQTANVADAAKKLMWGATAGGGQWCTSPGYAYVHESVAEEFVAECRKAVIDLFGENPKQNPDYSRIINAREVRRLAQMVDKEKVILGGDYDEAERYFAPTILYPALWTDKIMQGEIFGPILPILTYSNLREAITQIKSRPSPLAGYIFSRDQGTIDEFGAGFLVRGRSSESDQCSGVPRQRSFRGRRRIRDRFCRRKIWI